MGKGAGSAARVLLDEELDGEDLAAAGAAPPDDRSDEAWVAEIERRARAALAGSPGVPWERVRAELERRFGLE